MKCEQELGMKWYKFFLNVRPWIGIFVSLSVIGQGINILMSLQLYSSEKQIYISLGIVNIVISLVSVVLQGILLKKRQGNDYSLFKYIKVILMFDVFLAPVSVALNNYSQGSELLEVLIIYCVLVFIMYFIWYFNNIRYFRKRLPQCEIDERLISKEDLRTNKESSFLLDDNMVNDWTGIDREKADGEVIKWRTPGKWILAILLIISVGINIYSLVIKERIKSDRASLTESNDKLMKDNEFLERYCKQLEQEKGELKANLKSTKAELSECYDDIAFYNKNVVFVEDNGTGLYHNYCCVDFVGETFSVYNVEAVNSTNYEPCSKCIPVGSMSFEEYTKYMRRTK